MIKLIITIILITAIFYPIQSSWAFIIFFASFEGYLFLTSLRKSEYSLANIAKDINLNEEEKKILKKYYLYFRYPYASKSFSTSLSFIALSAFIFVPWLLYNHLWLQATIIGLNYIFAQMLSSKLNIRFYLHDAVERLHKEEFREEMLLADSVCDKILKK